jgi:hypothetical protein
MQLGGSRVRAVSIISVPIGHTADPRSYRPTVADRDVFSSAQLLILNGAGYDPWAGELANSAPGIRRAELNIGDNVGVSPGGNPYLWYDPGYVQEAAALIVGDYARIDPAGALPAGHVRRRPPGVRGHRGGPAHRSAATRSESACTTAAATRPAAQVAQAKAAGIPVVPLSAMLTPANATFQQWQAGTVAGVAQALGAARSH